MNPNISAWLGRTPSLAYLLLYGTLFLEGAGVPGMPCAALFLAVGVLAAKGRISLAWAVATGTAAILSGNLASYLVGRRVGGPVLSWLATRIGYREEQTQRASEFFRRYGGLAVLAARWFLPLRAACLVLAGQAGLPLPLFLVYALPSAVAWVLGWQYGAFALARGTIRWTGLTEELELATGLLGLAAILLPAAWLVWALLRRGAQRR